MNDTLFLEKLGQNISKIRKEKGLTQVELGNLCDFDKSTIHRLESGRSNPTVITLKKVAAGLQIGVEDLLRFDEKKRK
jgi:putative transcriptional regulator